MKDTTNDKTLIPLGNGKYIAIERTFDGSIAAYRASAIKTTGHIDKPIGSDLPMGLVSNSVVIIGRIVEIEED